MSRKSLLICGILSSILYVAMNLFIPIWYDGYSSVSQTVSELSAIDAPTRMLWVIPGFLYTLLVAAFGWGVWKSAGVNRPLRIVGILLFIYGIIGIGWAFAPMHQREVLAAGGGTISDTLHIAYSMVSVALMMGAIGFGTVAFGKGFRMYSIATIIILIFFGYLTSVDAPRLEKDLLTPWLGLWERILIGVFLLWVVVLAMKVLRLQKTTAI